MTIFRSKRGLPLQAPPPLPELTHTLEQLAERNAELKRRQEELEKRIHELEALRASLFPTRNRA